MTLNKLNQTGTELLLSIINGTNIKMNNRVQDAIDSLKEKGFIRVNEHHIIELSLCDDYFKQRGYNS